jgi:hypothetical protein
VQNIIKIERNALFSFSLFPQKSDRKKREKYWWYINRAIKNDWQLLHIKITTGYFKPNHIMTTATMSTIIIAFVIAAICQLGTMGEEEKVSIHKRMKGSEMY